MILDCMMAGNVAEWVQDVYRLRCSNNFNYFRGNQYTKNKIGADGKLKLLLHQYEIRYFE
jgi:formylglycine-generating enzyme required for sulfatase activity